jgi:uncharacterized protein YuzE
MKIEYDPQRDLLYIWFGAAGTTAAQTTTVSPGVQADCDARGKPIGLEVLDATEIFREERPVRSDSAIDLRSFSPRNDKPLRRKRHVSSTS